MSRSLPRATATALALCLVSAPAAAAPSAPRRACPDAQPPAGAAPPEGALAGTVTSARAAAHVDARVAVVPLLAGFCTTRDAVFLGAAELPAAELTTSARIAYALGAWAGGRSGSPQDAELHAAGIAGCALGRLGVRGDELTTQLLDLRDWSGPHPDARAWTRAAQEGHSACAP